MSIPSDLESAFISSIYGRENSSGTVHYPSPSKIPLPKCLVGSSVRIGRSRIELRSRNLAGVKTSKVGICKLDSQENDFGLLYSKSEPRTLFTAARMRGNGDVAVETALTPIMINAYSASDGQDGGSMTTKTTQHLPASQFPQSTNPSRLGQPTSNSRTPIRNEFREWIDDGGSRELNSGQTLVWSNGVIGTDKSNGEQSTYIESNSSNHCVISNSTHTASNETPFVSGAMPSLFTRNTGVAGLSSRFILCSYGGETLSPEVLPSMCERSNDLKFVESTRLSTSGVLVGDSTFIKISNNGSYLANDAECTMNSFSNCHSSDEKHRTSSKMMALEDAPLGSSDTKCELRKDQPQDFMPTKKNLFDAALLEEEETDLVAFQPISAKDTTLANSLSPQCREELHIADTSSISGNFEDTTEPENLYIVHNCREFRKDQSKFQASFPHHVLGHCVEESLEAQLEDDIQRDIEDEISKEISLLSEKLANLQARHGAQRMLDGSLPAVLSCPVTPVLTPRVRQRSKGDACSEMKDVIGDESGCRHKRGRVVAAKVFQGNPNRTPGSGTSEKIQQSRLCGQGCAIPLNVQKVMRKEVLGRRCSSSNSNAATQGCTSSSENVQQATQEEHRSHHGDDSLAGTPSSGSIRSNATDYTLKPKARTLHGGVTSPQVFPDNNRRFEWVKTLRSGETGVRSSPSSFVSKQPLKLPTPRKQLVEDTEFDSKLRVDIAKKKREALLADMTTELETRLNELAIRTTVESAQIPALKDTQATRNVGRVIASRYATSSEPRVEKHPEGSIPKDVSEEYGCLDKRTAVHLMKAGLTRGLAGKKQGSYCKSTVVKPEKLGERLPKRRSVGIQHDNSDSGQPCLDEHSSDDRPEQIPTTWSKMKETFETEYETFIEGPTDDPKISGPLNVTKNSKEQNSGKIGTFKISPAPPTEEGSTALSTTSRGLTLRSKSKRQPVKRTFIRCIEVVVDQPLADRTASAANRNLSTLHSRISAQSNKKIEPEVLKGSSTPRSEPARATSNHNYLNPDMTDANHSATFSLHEKLSISSKIEEPKSVKTNDQPLKTVFKLYRKTDREEGNVQDMSLGPRDQQVPSCDGEWKTEVTAADQMPLLSSLRERWEELIDALEKERLRLPKIRTETGNTIVSSPRDSGCVKRITERLKSMECHFSPENLMQNGLQGQSDDPSADKFAVASEFTSCVESDPSCTDTEKGRIPPQRLLQSHRKGALQAQTKLTKRHWKLPQSTKNHDIQQRSGKTAVNPRKFTTNESPTPQSEIESFDLESFWCLVRESEDNVQTAHPPSAAVR